MYSFKSSNLFRTGFLILLVSTTSCSVEDEVNALEENNTYENTEDLFSKRKPKSDDDVCTPEGNNTSRIYTFPNDVNKTTVWATSQIDDRTCAYDYTQETFNNLTYGVYKLKTNSNHFDNLQPRIERPSRAVNTTGNGSYVLISGYVTIREAGHVSDQWPFDDVRNQSGSYFIQAKGKHTNPDIGSNDPAICLLLAKPKFTGQNQTSFDIYREEITKRGGSGTTGRQMVFLTNIPANTRKFVSMKNGFNANNEQYVNITIGDTDYNWIVPNSIGEVNGLNQVGTQAKIRFGAYRCKGGEADILWDTVNQSYNEVQ
jgi:hypothetical protein